MVAREVGASRRARALSTRLRSSAASMTNRSLTAGHALTRRARTGLRRSPHQALDVALGAHEDIDQRAIIEIMSVQVGRDAALVERTPLFDLLAEDLEQAVSLDASNDLFLVVE